MMPALIMAIAAPLNGAGTSATVMRSLMAANKISTKDYKRYKQRYLNNKSEKMNEHTNRWTIIEHRLKNRSEKMKEKTMETT